MLLWALLTAGLPAHGQAGPPDDPPPPAGTDPVPEAAPSAPAAPPPAPEAPGAAPAAGSTVPVIEIATESNLSTLAPRINTEEAPRIKVELGLRFSMQQSDYTSRQLSADGDIDYRWTLSEVSSEFRIDREYVQSGDTDAEIQSDEYDANIKWKRKWLDNPFYGYVSPRLRYNRFGYFRSSQAWSIGFGRRFEPLSGLSLSAEFGPGLRWARKQAGGHVFEALYSLAGKLDYELTDTLTAKLNIVDERSNRENYRTLALSLRNRLTERLWLKYEVNYRKAFPFDDAPSQGESSFDAGLSYRF
jgi:putative salt-induced outer membrane protein YdiY